MPTPGRSGYNASKLRVEDVSSDKTIAAHESGEVYIVSGSSAIELTLPSAASGRYIKVMSHPLAAMELTCSAANSSEVFAGNVFNYKNSAGNVEVLGFEGTAYRMSGTCDGTTLSVEFIADGTRWFVNGYATGSAWGVGV